MSWDGYPDGSPKAQSLLNWHAEKMHGKRPLLPSPPTKWECDSDKLRLRERLSTTHRHYTRLCRDPKGLRMNNLTAAWPIGVAALLFTGRARLFGWRRWRPSEGSKS